MAEKTKKPAAFFLRRGLLPAVRQSWRKNRPHNGRAGVAADLSIVGRGQIHRSFPGHTRFELLDPPARIFIPRDDPESLASAPRPESVGFQPVGAATIYETKRMYRKLAEQADHPVVKNEMPELASSIGRLCMQSALDTKRSDGKDDVVARGCSPPKAAQLVKWWPVISWSRRLPNSGAFS
jgi:hypothetical protein